MQPDEPNEERLEQLPEDGQTPFSPADPPSDPSRPIDDSTQGAQLDSTHPATDSGIEPEELYEAGLPDTTGAIEPNAGDAVTGIIDEEAAEEE